MIIELPHPLLKTIGRVADRLNIKAYVVGGYVRDLLLGKEDSDIDILVLGDGVQFAHSIANELGKKTVVTFEKFGTAAIPLDGGKVEFVGARKERYDTPSRNPDISIGTLSDDLSRRDFTVNALAVSLNKQAFGQLEDQSTGLRDIEEKILRTPLDPFKTYEDDPLRMMRAIRFSSQLGFRIEDQSFEAIRTMKSRISIVSQERITEEFLKILNSPRPSVGLRLMHDTGVMEIVFLEVSQMAGVDQRNDQHHKDVFLHTCIVVDNLAVVSENIWLRFAALVHDIAKPRTKDFKEGIGWTFHGHEEVGARMMKGVFRQLKLPLQHLSYVEKLVRMHLRPMALVDEIVTDSAVRRLVFDAGEDIDDLMALCRADITSKNPRLVAKYIKNYDAVMEKVKMVEEKDRLRNWQPPLKGDEIMAVCGIPPGKTVGIVKKAIEEAILDGLISNDHDSALQFLLSNKDELLGSKHS